MGKRCLHVLKRKLLSNHILVVHYNVEGCGHMPLDFHVFTKESLIYKCRSSTVLKIGFKKEEVSKWALIWGDGSSYINSPPTRIGVGHQWTASTSTSCNQWLSLAKPTPKVPLACRNRTLVPRINKYGWAINVIFSVIYYLELEIPIPFYEWRSFLLSKDVNVL